MRLTASADGTNLWVAITTAGNVPESISSVQQELTYLLVNEADDSGSYDYWATVENTEDAKWIGSLTDWATGLSYYDVRFPGVISVAANVVSFRIPLTTLGSPSSVRIALVTQRADHTDGTVLAQDEVPAGAFTFVPTKQWLVLKTMTDLEAAWDAVHEALPPFWRVGPVTFDPGILRPDGHMGAYSVTARGPHPGGGKVPQKVTGTGASETEALRALDARLRGREDAGGNVEALRARLRLAYVQGAGEWTQEQRGRPMTTREIRRVIGRYTGR